MHVARPRKRVRQRQPARKCSETGFTAGIVRNANTPVVISLCPMMVVIDGLVGLDILQSAAMARKGGTPR